LAAILIWRAKRARQSLRRKIKRLLGRRFVATLLVPLIAAIPPVILAATDEKKNFWPAWLWKLIRDFLTQYPALATAALVWPGVVIVLAYAGGWIRKRFIDLDELTATEYGLILRALDEIDGNKMARFGNLAADTQSATIAVNPDAIFQTITQPSIQIAAIISAIYLVFRLDAEATDPQNTGALCVTLARLKKSQFEKFEVWVPQTQAPSSSRQHLRRKESAIERAATTRKPVIVNDIARELKRKHGEKRFCAGAPGSSEDGSIIAFPVFHQPTNDVPYVITIRSQHPGHFVPRLRDRYAILLQPFVIRISIEHSLALLKEYHASGHKQT
jgi:hypothetical protein